jgi:hypothetical protein
MAIGNTRYQADATLMASTPGPVTGLTLSTPYACD